MLKLRSVVLVLIYASAHVVCEDPRRVIKCCKKGRQLDAHTASCVKMEGVNVSSTVVKELLYPPLDANDSYWLPKLLHSATLQVRYGEIAGDWNSSLINATDDMVERLLAINSSQNVFELSPFHGHVLPISVVDQHFCFDVVNTPSARVVFKTSVVLRTLNKCCRKGEILKSKKNGCERIPGRNVKEIDQEVLKPYEEFGIWLPVALRASVVKVWYKQYHFYNIQLNADNATSWQLNRLKSKYRMSITEESRNYSSVKFSRHYCFDGIAGQMPYQRVLRVRYMDIATKCCRKGEVLEYRELQCVRSDNLYTDVDFEEIDSANDINNATTRWLPSQLATSEEKITVKYGYQGFLSRKQHFFPAEGFNEWHIEYAENGEPTLALALTNSWKNVIRTQDYCFDAVVEYPRVHRFLNARIDDPGMRVFFKCCSIGKRLAPDGSCEENPGDDWYPSFRTESQNVTGFKKPFVVNFVLSSVCKVPYDVLGSLSYVPEKNIDVEEDSFSFRVLCYDQQRTGNGIANITMAICEIPPNALLFKKIRPLQMVAAALLATSVATILSRGDMRSNTHGWAMAFHAVCLMACNGLQAIWFFTSHKIKNCDLYAYAIYFFLLAGACWLSAVVVNMTHGFRQPLGAMARGEEKVWRRMALLSAFAF